MFKQNISKDELFSAIRGLPISDYSCKELEALDALFELKSRQIQEEIRKRKHEGKD